MSKIKNFIGDMIVVGIIVLIVGFFIYSINFVFEFFKSEPYDYDYSMPFYCPNTEVDLNGVRVLSENFWEERPIDVIVEIEDYTFNTTIDSSSYCYHPLHFPTHDLDTDSVVSSVNKTKEEVFFKKNINYFLADRLETEYVGEGEGDITGTRKVSTGSIYGNLFWISGYIGSQSYKIHDKLTFRFKLNPQYPTVLLDEDEFETTKRRLQVKTTRCVQLEDERFLIDDEYPYVLICVFEKEGTHFVTEMESLLDGYVAEKIELDVTVRFMIEDYPIFIREVTLPKQMV